MSLAIFDLDNTLIAGDSDHAWGDYLIDLGLVDGAAHRHANDAFYQDYLAGTLDIQRYLEFALQPLARFPLEQLLIWRQTFIEQRIRPLLLPDALALLQRHRGLGHTLLIITATNRFITEPIATLLGVDDLIATDPEMRDGHFTGRISGIPSYRQGKVTRLETWLLDHPHDLTQAHFYSDSHNDIPLLERVGHPVAVDADPTLLETARRRGWPTLSLRS